MAPLYRTPVSVLLAIFLAISPAWAGVSCYQDWGPAYTDALDHGVVLSAIPGAPVPTLIVSVWLGLGGSQPQAGALALILDRDSEFVLAGYPKTQVLAAAHHLNTLAYVEISAGQGQPRNQFRHFSPPVEMRAGDSLLIDAWSSGGVWYEPLWEVCFQTP